MKTIAPVPSVRFIAPLDPEGLFMLVPSGSLRGFESNPISLTEKLFLQTKLFRADLVGLTNA
jgi:hypothetical protein